MPRATSTILLPLAEIRRDGNTQSRAEMSAATIEEYAESYRSGAAMPPVVVFRDEDGAHWLADGFHRCEGAEAAGKDSVLAEVREGSVWDARWFALGANSAHGLQRTHADRRLAVVRAFGFLKEQRRTESDRYIADQCHVSRMTVGRVRAELSQSDSCAASSERTGRDGKKRKLPTRAPAAEDSEPEHDTEPPPSDPQRDDAEDLADDQWQCAVCGTIYTDEIDQCGHCTEDEESEPEPAPPQSPSRNPPPTPPAPPQLLEGTVAVADLQRLREQRESRPEYQSLRMSTRAVGQLVQSPGQRVIDFVLDGGELALLRLGLDWSASEEAVKRAYRDASRTAHPDRGGSSAEFVALTQAKDMVLQFVEQGS